FAVPRVALPYILKHIAPLAGPMVRLYEGKAVRILTAGLNESAILKGQTQPQVKPDRFRSYLGMYAAIGAELGIPTIYVGPQMVDNAKTHPAEGYGATIENDLVGEYAQIVQEHAEKQGSPFVGVRALFAPYIEDR